MSAASYIGRVGGLAVALGVGSAIVTGVGVANATPATDGENSQTGNEDGGGGATTPTQGTDSRDPGKIDFKLPRLSDIIGRHRADSSTPNSNTATSIVKRLSDAAKRVTDAIENAADADNTVVRQTTTTGGSSLRERREAARAEKVDDQASTQENLSGGAAATNNVVANQIVNRAAAVKDWISSPRALAGRSLDTTPPTPTPGRLWTPPQILAPLGTMQATPGSGAVRTTSILTTVLSGISPFAGNGSGTPAGVSPLGMLMAGAARREVGIESYTPTALLAQDTNSLTYAPTPTFLHGIIGGTNTAAPGVTYLVVSQPSEGGKVYVDPTTGSYTYLPNLSVVKTDGSETFKVVAAETTVFTEALTGIPLVGGLVDQVLIVLYQVPVVNVVLSPIIGKSKITSVTVDLTDVDGYDSGDPVAFTVMVPSDDGVMISTNYFPAWSVADGLTDAAPTVLNGPGLATAGNINPDAANTVDGLVPGITELTSAGFNVVTWDPRGEFDSTGRLELDSPEYEGQDVKNIISWIVANRDVTYQEMETVDPTDPTNPAKNDPWIGMVGGSYGGGIQLVSAAIDNRIDVIVPGIAWNNLNDSLYTSDAFKTSYSSLLLLGLVTTGSRINPQIYGGIITGAVLGVLLPGQQALLERSGPWDIVGGIDAPTLFVQGTVDVLFPLQQAVTNAENIGTTDISMIWFCGGHGACLTLDQSQQQQQDAWLLGNTLNWLDAVLPEEYADQNSMVVDPHTGGVVEKFQWVDQLGQVYTADELPTEGSPFFGNDLDGLIAQGSGGRLFFAPLIGGSGPQSAAGFPTSLGLGSEASNAISIPIDPGFEDGDGDTQVVGPPHLTFDYRGVGTSRHVYAQIVDTSTGQVVGNIVTPVDVTLDGRARTADVNMEDIAWTYSDDTGDPNHEINYDDLELQIVGSATPYLNFTEFGYIDVSNVQLTFPTAASATPGPEFLAAS